jgi:hypothetical protein
MKYRSVFPDVRDWLLSLEILVPVTAPEPLLKFTESVRDLPME